jgi:aminoglycoside phosphotransferase (APT) family kinase protein
MEPDVAMRMMLDPQYAVWLVVEGVVGDALANATNAIQAARRHGLTSGDTMISALAELHRRARDITPETIAAAAHTRRKLEEAQAAYSEAAAKITVHLGYPVRN